MSTADHNLKSRSTADWLRPQLRWITAPSWLVSVFAHVGLAMLLLMLSQLPSCQRDVSGNDGESFREVGIHQSPATPFEAEATPENHSDSPPPMVEDPLDQTPPDPLEKPPVELALPNIDVPAVIGAGANFDPSSMAFPEIVQPSITNSPAPGTGIDIPVPGGASFLGISDTATEIVYIIDRSFSMGNDNALEAAKLELQASLQRLESTQRFQVIFYSDNHVVLKTRGEGNTMFWATDAQRLQVAQQVRSIHPAGGTRHMPALQKALSFQPDVIFLLTDGAADSALSSQEMVRLKSQNRKSARIHCIEFGRSKTPGEAGNFLRKLAKDHGGKYTYRNVKLNRTKTPRN